MKWAVFDGDRRVVSGDFDRLHKDCVLVLGERRIRVPVHDHAAAVRYLLSLLEKNRVLRKNDVTSVVHRVVHGGEKHDRPVIITQNVIHDIEKLSVLAPLHNPANLAGIRAAKDAFPKAAQIAIFDTAFHHTISKEVFLYGLPLELYERFGIRKYGFHGINHSYIASVLEERFGHAVDAISCHLGAGSSITALRHGYSADTTMGFTPLDGLFMATRSGELDPEIPLFLLREGHYTIKQLDDLFSRRSGLLGITGHADLREVWRAAQVGDERSRLAIDMLAYRIAYFVNAMRTTVPRPEAIAFTGGIGEGAWYVRSRVCALLEVPLDEERNREGKGIVSVDGSPVTVIVIPADEQLQMHRLSKRVLQR